MGDETHLAPRSKSLADILAEELDGEVGNEQTQESSVAEKQARLKAVYERIHQEQPARSAICLSGGGIRSAIFGLGILQGLAKTHLLGAFDYLSTVSGGGYVGGWLTAWIKNHPRGAEGVLDELQRRPESTLNPEPQPIRHLRIFSNYLTPKTGLTSVDTWTLIASYVRNMFLNWLVLISWLAAAMMIPPTSPGGDFTATGGLVFIAGLPPDPASLQHRPDHFIGAWVPAHRHRDGVLDLRCSIHRKRSIFAGPFPDVPAAAVAFRVSRSHGMVGPVSQYLWKCSA